MATARAPTTFEAIATPGPAGRAARSRPVRMAAAPVLMTRARSDPGSGFASAAAESGGRSSDEPACTPGISRTEPSSFTMLIEGKGPQGQVSGEGLIEISADGEGTLVRWSGDPQVRGTLARIGSRVIQPAAKMIIGQFFKCLEKTAETTATVS